MVKYLMANDNISPCPVAKKCGGCKYQGLPYEKQLSEKQQLENKLLSKFCKVSPIIGMEKPYYYRNKVHHAFSRDKSGQTISGIYEANSHRIVATDCCLLEDLKSQEIISAIQGMLKSFKIQIYNEQNATGFLRHILVRRAFKTGEIMVVLVVSGKIFPSKNNFVKALLQSFPEISTIILSINSKRTSMVLGDENITIYGKGYITDILCGLKFRISPDSFYQVNPVQTEILYNTAMDFAALTGKETVFDAYCGIGTIGMVAAKNSASVTSVELNGNAVKDAISNGKINDMQNIRFFKGDAGEFMEKIAYHHEKMDVLFMDPPRSGSDETFMKSVCILAPEKIVYISCNPETLARDLEYFTNVLHKVRYTVEKIQPVDMFPHTEHLETVVLMSRSDR